jgi:hypothetical protein
MQPIVILINFMLGCYVLVSVYKYMQSLKLRETSGPVQACNGIALHLHKIKLETLEKSIYGRVRGLQKTAK